VGWVESEEFYPLPFQLGENVGGGNFLGFEWGVEGKFNPFGNPFEAVYYHNFPPFF